MEACRIYQIEKPVLKKTRQTANWIRSERTEKFSFIFFFSVVNFTEWFRLFQIHWFGDKFNPRKGSGVPQKDIWHPTFLSSDFSFLFHRFFFFFLFRFPHSSVLFEGAKLNSKVEKVLFVCCQNDDSRIKYLFGKLLINVIEQIPRWVSKVKRLELTRESEWC